MLRNIVPRIKLEDIISVEFRKGSTNMFVRTMDIDQPKIINFPKDNFELKEAPAQKSPRGVEVTKKKDIIAA